MRIAKELAEFKSLKKSITACLVDDLGEYTIALYPHGNPKPTTYEASITALTHGNEVGGVAVLNELLRLLAAKIVHLPFSLLLSLNNPQAALANQRFIDEDLSRCFGAKEKSSDNRERRLAGPIEVLLKESQINLDIHQTQLPLPLGSSFWPALANEANIFAIRAIDPTATIVTTRPKTEAEAIYGVSIDNFMAQQGKIGITIELGDKGFSSYQISHGVHVVLNYLRFVSAKPKTLPTVFMGREYITIGHILADEGTTLRQDLVSFLAVKKGEVIATKGDITTITAPQDCLILFPKIHGQIQFSARDPLCTLIVLSDKPRSS